MHGLEKQYAGQIDFIRVNILQAENKAIMEQFSFSTTPEFYLVNKQREIINFWADDVTEEELRQAFDQVLGK